jgi:hypothetical protein
MSGYESILQELATAYVVEVSLVPHDRVEWGIDRLRRLVAPLELPSFMLAFWRAFPDSSTWKVPVPFAAVYDDFEPVQGLPNVMVPIASYEGGNVILLEVGYDDVGWIWNKHYWDVDSDFHCWGPADQVLLALAVVRTDPESLAHDREVVPGDPSFWPETWKAELLAPNRFDPPTLTITEFVAESKVRVAYIEAELKVPLEGSETGLWLLDDGTGTLWIDPDMLRDQPAIDPWHNAFHGRPVPPRMDKRRIGPPLPGQLFRLLAVRDESGEIEVRPHGWPAMSLEDSDEEHSEQRLLILRAERDSGSTALFGFVDPATPLETTLDMHNFLILTTLSGASHWAASEEREKRSE